MDALQSAAGRHSAHLDQTMTRILDLPTMSRLVQQVGTAQLIGLLADAIRDDFVHWSGFEKSTRLTSQSPDGVNELMPVANQEHFAFKYVSCHPGNTGSGLFSVMAVGMLAEAATGRPLLISEGTLATALRTAATSLVAARVLARPDARRMALIGNGAQSEFQALAFHRHLGIDEITVYDVDPAATDKLVHNLEACSALRVIRSESVAQAVQGADIVTTVTAAMAHGNILRPEMVEPGMHLHAVGGDCVGKTELQADVLRSARVFVEFEPQTRVEGEIQQLPPDFAVVELWRVLSGSEQGRQDANQVTVFDSVGFALEDYTVLRLLYAIAERDGWGTVLEMSPGTGNPKDLFRFAREPAKGAAGHQVDATRGPVATAPCSGTAPADRGGRPSQASPVILARS